MAELTETESVAAGSGIPGLPDDWPQQATVRVVDVVDRIRAKTTGPAIRVSRAIVYGLVSVILLAVALPLLLVGATRGLISLVDLTASHETAVWVSYSIVGGIFILVGLLLWSRRPKGAARV